MIHERGRIMRSAIFLAVGFVVAVGLAVPVQADLTNGGFETGDLTGWIKAGPGNVLPGEEDAARVIQLIEYNPYWSFPPHEGTRFAIVDTTETDDGDFYNTLAQTFSAAAGDVLDFAVFFATIESITPGAGFTVYDDNGYVSLFDETGAAKNLYPGEANDPPISVNDVGSIGSDGWRTISYVFSEGGIYTLEAGVTNITDEANASYIGLDAVRLTPATNGQIPEPASLAIWGALGGLGLISARRNRKIA